MTWQDSDRTARRGRAMVRKIYIVSMTKKLDRYRTLSEVRFSNEHIQQGASALLILMQSFVEYLFGRAHVLRR